MNYIRSMSIAFISVLLLADRSAPASAVFDLSWHTIDCGGVMASSGNGFELSGTIGQPDAGVMAGGDFELVGGFWGAAAPAGAGAPAATLIGALSRKSCDLDVLAPIASDPRQGGITELRLSFDVAPGGPGANPVTIHEATCALGDYRPYTGASLLSATIAGNDLVLAFTPGLENARTYLFTIGPEITSLAGQTVELRGLVGDVNGDGQVNALDRSVVIGAWTGAGFSCHTDVNNDGSTNAVDRSVIIGAWTGGQNCAP